MKEKIVDLAMNNASIRDTARALHISINAVMRTLKNSRRIQLICEVDEMWSFVGNKKQQRWL